MILAQRLLLAAYGGFWTVLGTLAATSVLTFGLEDGVRVLGVLMLCDGIAFLLAAGLSAHGVRFIDYATLLLIATNGVLSVTDEVGVFDAVSLAVCVIAFVLVFINMRDISRAPQP